MAYKTYSEKLKDPRWQMKRLEVLKRDNATCKLCYDKTTELQIHHLRYNGDPWEALDSDLVTLCKHCHCFVSIEKGEGNFNFKNVKRIIKIIRDGHTILFAIIIPKEGQDADNVIIINVDNESNSCIDCVYYNGEDFKLIMDLYNKK